MSPGDYLSDYSTNNEVDVTNIGDGNTNIGGGGDIIEDDSNNDPNTIDLSDDSTDIDTNNNDSQMGNDNGENIII